MTQVLPSANYKRIVVIPVTAILCVLSLTAFAQVAKWKEQEILGDTLYAHQDFAGAIKYYDKAIELSQLKEKDSYRSLYKRAVSYYSTEDFKHALEDISLFLKQYPEASQAKLLKAFIYRGLDDSENQLIALEEAMGMQPPNPDLLKWRGLLYLQKEDYEKTKRDMLAARFFQDDSEIETYLGLSFYNLHQSDSAFISFNKSIELDAMYLPAYLYAGSISIDEGNHTLALQYLNLALRLDSKNKEALFYKGAALVELNRVNEGCSCLNRAFYLGMDEAAGYLKEFCYQVED